MRAGLLLGCLVALGCDGCATHSFSKARQEKRSWERDARSAALHWLQSIDAGEYSDAYDKEVKRITIATSERQFIRSMKGRRAPFAGVLSRTFIGAAFTGKLTGAPDGIYESILFRTSFAHKSAAAERVILANESGQWRIVDYRLY